MGNASNSPLIEDKSQLIALIEKGCKPPDQWRIGTEHEKFGFRWQDLTPLEYDAPDGIRAVLEGLGKLGWNPVMEGDVPIGLVQDDGCSISLEPGGQLELSGAPVETIHQTCNEVNTHLAQVKQVADPLDIGFLGIGFHPKWPRERFPWMPKARYKIMRDYMPRVGEMGLDMMVRTCTVQVNLDFASEADMVNKFRVGLALQPVATALFANSPFLEGRPSGYLSYRSHAWTHTDPDRAGMLPFVFESGMGFERWVDYALDVPMYFVRRDGRYIDVSGESFRKFMEGKLTQIPGERATVADFEDHMTTIFPEVRLKSFLEMRGADGGPWRRLCALPAFWVGLLYDDDALQAAMDLTRDWDTAARQQLRTDVPRLGLEAEIGGRPLKEVAIEVLAIARSGLRARNRTNAAGDDETGFLTPLFEIVDSGLTPAQRKLELYRTDWNQSVDPLFKECAY